MSDVVERLPDRGRRLSSTQADAARLRLTGVLISTDPPYYDNIVYSDLSDFFYVWLRRSLRSVHPDLLSTMLVPKAEELVANPYRHDGKDGAKAFFEDGFRRVFRARPRVPRLPASRLPSTTPSSNPTWATMALSRQVGRRCSTG